MSGSLKFMMSDTWPGGLTFRGDGLTGDLPLGVHMSCWKVAQLILGPSIEDNLELFAAIALQNARELIKPNGYIPLQLDCRGRKHWLRIEDRGLMLGAICIPRSVTRTGRPR
jgi:hypothetical protein